MIPYNMEDPIVVAGIAASTGRDMRDGLMLFSIICRSSLEAKALKKDAGTT